MGIIVDPGSTQSLTVLDGETITIQTLETAILRALSGMGTTPGTTLGTAVKSSVTYGPYPQGTFSVQATGASAVVTNRLPYSPPVTLSRSPSGEPTAISLDGSSYNTVVISVSPSGDLTGATDTANIQAAINRVAASSTARGRVELSGGQFYLQATNKFGSAYLAILMASNVDLIGINKPSLKLATSTQPNGYGGFLIFCANVAGINIRGLDLDGNRSGFTSPAYGIGPDGVIGSGVRCVNSTDISVTDCKVRSMIYHGLFAVDGCRRIDFSKNTIYDCGYRSMHFNGNDGATSDCTDSSFNYNFCYSNGQAADNPDNSGAFIALGNVARITCIGNIIKDEASAGIDIAGTAGSVVTAARDINVSNNVISNCKYGIRAGAGLLTSTISNNTITGCATYGMFLGASKSLVVSDNTIKRTIANSGVVLGWSASDVLEGLVFSGNIVEDNDGNTTTRVALYINTGQHIGLKISGNTFLNNGMTAASTCGGVAFGDPGSNKSKSVSITGNLFKNNKGHAVMAFDTDNLEVSGNQFMDNFEPTGPRGRAIWIRGTADGTNVKNNIVVNDNIANSLEQIYFDATTTNSRCVDNTAECAATNKFFAATGATGAAYGNTGTASWPVGFVTGTAAV